MSLRFFGVCDSRDILNTWQHLLLACQVCREVCGVFRYQTLRLHLHVAHTLHVDQALLRNLPLSEEATGCLKDASHSLKHFRCPVWGSVWADLNFTLSHLPTCSVRATLSPVHSWWKMQRHTCWNSVLKWARHHCTVTAFHFSLRSKQQ